MENNQDNNKVTKPKIALPLSSLIVGFVGPTVSFLLLLLTLSFRLPDFFAVVFLLFSLGGILFAPIVGIVLGITSLCLGKRKIGLRGVIMAIVAIVSPIILLILIIILNSAGVAVIRFM